ncbi:MAG: ribonuclease E/G [Nitrososphaerota archaeon]|nr:ribonuclease E/G [Candidatus Bathyarchaeota archaeon]MDW8023263.1 ribonuclease E/G [Nitrososphaerota archaeon]
MKLRAKVRGIYTTALTKLLLENGFKIVQPSQAIKNRFGIQEDDEPPDMKIKDRNDLQGVIALGTAQATEAFQSALHSSLEDVITRKWAVSVNGIYKGAIIGRNESVVYVQIGAETVGTIPKAEAPSENQGTVTVQVERKRIGKKTPLLTTKIKIVGKNAILVKDGKVGVSLKIRDINKRTELYALGGKLSPEGWGIIWREPAAHMQKDFLEKEVAELADKAKALNEKAKSAEAPSLLVEGLHFLDVEFPQSSKRKLDELRATVTPTIDGHHFYKSCGGKVSAALEMAEKLLEKGQNMKDVKELFKRQIQPEFPEEGSTVDVEHVKLSGLVLRLGQATIESIDEEKIRYWRTIKTDGFYDGLGVAKEAGDKAVSETKPGGWHITTSYFSKNGVWKGAYINLNTPVEVYPKAMRYVDLEVDVCILPNCESKVLDMEKLEKAFNKGLLSKTLFQKVKETVETFTEKDFAERLKAKFI